MKIDKTGTTSETRFMTHNTRMVPHVVPHMPNKILISDNKTPPQGCSSFCFHSVQEKEKMGGAGEVLQLLVALMLLLLFWICLEQIRRRVAGEPNGPIPLPLVGNL